MQSKQTNQIARFFQLKKLFPLITIVVVIFSLFYTVQPAWAAAALTVQPLTWNVIGLDSNDVNAGPNNFPVGARVCNTEAEGETAQNVTAQLVWDSSNPYIALRTSSLGNVNHNTTSAISLPDLPGGNVAPAARTSISR